MQPSDASPGGSAAGWHRDPSGRYEFRYFNGERWTADVSVNGQRYVDPVVPTGPPAFQPGFGPGFQPGFGPGFQPGFQPGAHPGFVQRPPGRGFAVTAFTVGLCSLIFAWVPFVFVLGAAGAITAFVFGLLALGRVREGTGTGKSMAVWGLAFSVAAAGLCVVGFFFTRTVLREVKNLFDPGPYEITIDRCTTTDGLVQMDARILNSDTQTHGYSISVSYLDGNTMVDSDLITVQGVGPQAEAEFHAASFVDAAEVRCVVDNVMGVSP